MLKKFCLLIAIILIFAAVAGASDHSRKYWVGDPTITDGIWGGDPCEWDEFENNSASGASAGGHIWPIYNGGAGKHWGGGVPTIEDEVFIGKGDERYDYPPNLAAMSIQTWIDPTLNSDAEANSVRVGGCTSTVGSVQDPNWNHYFWITTDANLQAIGNAGYLNVGCSLDANGVVYMDDGEAYFAGALTVGYWGGRCKIFLTGGTMEFGGTMWIPRGFNAVSGTDARVYVHGGDLIADNLEMDLNWGERKGSIDITTSQLILAGDKRAKVLGFVNEPNGFITAYGAKNRQPLPSDSSYRGDVYVDYNSVDDKTIVTAGKIYLNPKAAKNPIPVFGAVDVSSREQILYWDAGSGASHHNVYLSTSFADVNTMSAGAKVASNITNEFFVAELQEGVKYYWSVYEVETGTPGEVWEFTTNDLVILGFEYESTTELKRHWKDDTTEASVSLSDTSRSGEHSLGLDYLNYEGSYFSEAYRDINLSDNTKLAEIWIYGDSGNYTDAVYLRLEDANGWFAVATSGPNMVAEVWQRMRFMLNDANDISKDANFDLGAVEKMTLGVGKPGEEDANTYMGIVYFDDIGLLKPHCVPLEGPEYDWTGDCVVNYSDLDMLIDGWLENETIITSGESTKPTANPVSWYKFDVNEGDYASDSSGHGFHITAGNFGDNKEWIEGGFNPGGDINDSNCLHFMSEGSNKTYADIPAAAAGVSTKKKTVMFWLKGDEGFHEGYNHDFAFNFGSDDLYSSIYAVQMPRYYAPDYGMYDDFFGLRFTSGQQAGNYDNIVYYDFQGFGETEEFWKGTWNHWAFTKNVGSVFPPPAVPAKAAIYYNGKLLTSATHSRTPGGITQACIGACPAAYNHGNGIAACMYDFRVYDEELTEKEIMWVAGFRPGRAYPLPREIRNRDIYPADGDGTINMKDFAVLADQWLYEQLWPLN